MEDYQVPQFIEDESRLVGPFTFAQITILVIGGGMAFMLYKVLRSFIGIPLALVVAFLTGLLCFAKINDLPLYKMILPIIKHFVLPKSYQWNQPKQKYQKQTNIYKKSSGFNLEELKPKKDLSQIDELTKILDKGNE